MPVFYFHELIHFSFMVDNVATELRRAGPSDFVRSSSGASAAMTWGTSVKTW